MKIMPIDSITPIAPVTPVKRKQKITRKHPVKEITNVTDDKLGRNVDITISGPLETPNCHNCISYYVTWDPAFPHGCKLFGFKSKNRLPSLSVYQATGNHCPFFENNTKIKLGLK
jgi:hypothetical protein